MAHTSKNGSSLEPPSFDPHREDSWKEAPSTEVTNDKGTNTAPDPGRRRHEANHGNPDEQAPGGRPQGT